MGANESCKGFNLPCFRGNSEFESIEENKIENRKLYPCKARRSIVVTSSQGFTMMLRPTNDQPLNKKPTTWDALVTQATSLAGRVESEHPFVHDFGRQVSSRIARGLGALKNGP
jgi:hypothetical protein